MNTHFDGALGGAPGGASRWARVRELFHGAIALPDGQRSVYLNQACATDASVYRSVAALLHAHEHAGNFLDVPGIEAALTWDADTPNTTVATIRTPSWNGKLVSHYRLDQCVGAGGMGVVYRARDVALGREAAVKLLPFALDPSLRDRLQPEADACARLQHPAIATYYESGESDGTAFIAMEFVPGRTLRQQLRDGPLPVDEALSVAACVLEGLCHAHAAGVLHRDIKPENIIITGPRAAKLLDFGIATLLFDAASVATASAAAGVSIAGTLGYMAPEQLRNQPLDARADVFQAAAVLYEMIAGVPAFPGETAAERLSAVLTRTPPALELPVRLGGLNAVLARGLAREPAARYTSAAAFLSDLRRASDGELAAGLPDSIAVIDFINASETPDDDWIASGIAEAIGDALAQVPTLTVTPRDRVLRARAVRAGQPLRKAVPALGGALGCRWILTGRYKRVDAALNASIALIEVSTGAVVARNRLRASLEQLFEVRDRAIATVRNQLGVTAFTSGVTATTPTAFECYARGRRLAVRNDRGAFDQARELFEAAIALDPSYAQAFAGLARLCALTYTFTSDTDTLYRALEYAGRALVIDPDLAEAEIWRGYAHNRLGNFDAADQSLARCRSLNPREVYGFYFGGAFRTARDPRRAAHLLQHALALDPLFGSAWWGLGCVFIYLTRYGEAVSCFDRCSRLAGVQAARPVPGIEGYWAEALRRMGRLDEARQKCTAGLEIVERSDFMYRDTNRVVCLVTLGRAALDQGDGPAARAAFQQAIGHVMGRPRTVAGGTLVVRALAGLSRVNRDATNYDGARRRFEQRHELNFSWVWMCDDWITCLELAEAATSVGQPDDARWFRERARAEAPLATW